MRRISSRELRRMMKRMGIEKIEELDVEYVELHYKDGKITRIYNPKVSKINIGGSYTYQIIGEEEELREDVKSFDEESISIVMEQTGVDRELAIKALELTDGDIAEAILVLKEGGLTD